jgi:hypothetical protein
MASDAKGKGADLDALADMIVDAVVAGLDRALDRSALLERLGQVLGTVEQRLRQIEREPLVKRVAELERQVEQLRAERRAAEPEPPPPPRPAPAHPPANLPESARMSNLPFGLTAEPGPRTPSRRPRKRNPVRPTVIYRSDPRKAAAGREDEAEPEGGEAPGECSEPGCERPVLRAGLCALHHEQRLMQQRTVDSPPVSAGPVPPPPRPAGKRKSAGGTRGVFAVLYEDRGRRVLAGMINQMKLDRADLVQRLNKHFEGLPGVPLEEEDVVRAVHYHKLGDALREREGAIICRHLTKQRGSMVKTAQKLKSDPDELQRRIEELHLQDEVARVRHEFREKVLEHSSFSERLDLALTKEKYLKDLGIEKEVDASLRAEIDSQLERIGPINAAAEADEAICQALGLDEQRYRRMVRRYELAARLEALMGPAVSGGEAG